MWQLWTGGLYSEIYFVNKYINKCVLIICAYFFLGFNVTPMARVIGWRKTIGVHLGRTMIFHQPAEQFPHR